MEEIKTFFEKLLDSYEARIKFVSKAMKATVDHLHVLSKEQAKMAVQLRDFMAKDRSFRKRDFDSLLQNVVLQNLDKEKEISLAVVALQKEGESMSARLRKIISGEVHITLSEFKLMSKEIIGRLSAREKDVSDMLRQFHIEQGELSKGLTRLLSKGENLKIRDFKAMTEAIQIRRQERTSEVGRLLDDLEEGQQEINMQWEELRKSYVFNL